MPQQMTLCRLGCWSTYGVSDSSWPRHLGRSSHRGRHLWGGVSAWRQKELKRFA
jgi:hypothetical protein